MQSSATGGADPGFSIKAPWSAVKWPQMDINITVLQSIPGAFKVAHLVFGLISLSLVARYCQYFHPLTGNSLGFLCSNSATFFLLVSYSCFVTSILLLLCCLFSYFTASFLPKTAFECSFYGFACAMYFFASVTLLVTVVTANKNKSDDREPGYEAKITAAVFGLITCILYGISTFYSVQFQRQLEQAR